MEEGNWRTAFAEQYLETVRAVLAGLPSAPLGQALEALERAQRERCHVFLVGNGGSAATAAHMANDLMRGSASSRRPGIRAIALTDNTALVTSIANDIGYEEIFAGQLAALGRPGDLLVVISASGNSPNIVRAVETAQQIGMTTIGLLGMGGGKVARMVDIPVVVPSNEYGPVEDAHMVLDHLATAYLRHRLETDA